MGWIIFVIGMSLAHMTAANDTSNRSSIRHNITSARRPFDAIPHFSSIGINTKSILGMESLMGVMGPLALAAVIGLPFMAPAAAALLPLAGLSSVFGRRRRHLEGPPRRLDELERLGGLRGVREKALRLLEKEFEKLLEVAYDG